MSLRNSNNEKRRKELVLIDVDKELYFRGRVPRYTLEENRMRFIKGSLTCFKYKLMGETTGKNKIYFSIYQLTSKLRKKLEIPGKGADPIRLEYRKQLDYIPEILFSKRTVEESLKNIEMAYGKVGEYKSL